MSKVFKFSPTEEGRVLSPIEESDIEVLFSTALAFHEPKALPHSIQVKTKGHSELEKNTFFWIHPNCIVCDFYAYKSLNFYIAECGFWNELLFDGKAIYLFTVTKTVFSLNEEKSDFIELDGIKLDVKEYFFDDFDASQNPIFLLGNMKGHYPLVSEFLVKKVSELGIRGMKFDQIN